jgi:hypothetical protein
VALLALAMPISNNKSRMGFVILLKTKYGPLRIGTFTFLRLVDESVNKLKAFFVLSPIDKPKCFRFLSFDSRFPRTLLGKLPQALQHHPCSSLGSICTRTSKAPVVRFLYQSRQAQVCHKLVGTGPAVRPR